MSKSVRRLYDHFRPTNYRLNLAPDRGTMTFTGSVLIEGQKIGRPTKRLTFHQKGLIFSSAVIEQKTKNGWVELTVARINKQNGFDEVRLHTKDRLLNGSYRVSLNFSGQITKAMNGIYPCFFESKSKDKILVATQFESHHAREVFPSIDEPEAKATFDLTLTTPTGEAVIANTPIDKQSIKKQTMVTTFQTTPRMSTYLLAFVYGEMDFREDTTPSGITVRCYATPDNAQFTQFALDCAVKILDFYNDYFDIPYPLPKCDLLALPDFASGAMENWGCITFREQTLLVDPANTSISTKQYVAMVVAHELAHQWFGNLVTMRWWTDLWLNEGFASWIEYLAIDHLFPEWKMWTQFIVDEQEVGLRLDSLVNTHPIEVEIKHPDEIRTIFDSISYSKGSSVIHMLQKYLGQDIFRDGLRYYLKSHAYQNTDTVDLWAALEKVSAKPVSSFMHAWTTQAGYPIVEVKKGKQNTLSLQQQRFYLNPKSKQSELLWPIPISRSEQAESMLFDTGGSEFEMIKNSGRDILNPGHSGFYRTIFDPALTAQLGALIQAGKLDELDRVGLISDATESAKAGYLGTVEVFKLLDFYRAEDSSVVWDIISGLIASTRQVMDDEALRDNLKPFTREITASQLERLGWEAKPRESHFDTLLRPTILALSSVAEEPAVTKEALKRFKNMKRPEDIEPDLRSIIYSTAARLGNEAEFDKMLEMHNSTSSSEERLNLTGALTSFKQPKNIQRALKMIKSDQVRLQDAAYWLAYSFGNRYAKVMAWEWMVENWSWLDTNLGSDLSFYRFPIYAARAFSKTDFLKTYKDFFDQHNNPGLERSILQGIETIEWQSAWRSRDLKPLQQLFAKDQVA